MSTHRSDHLEFSTTRIEMFGADLSKGYMGTGTGFFISTPKGTKYLVTNWHIVTGKRPEVCNKNLNPHENYSKKIPLNLKIYENIGSPNIEPYIIPLYDNLELLENPKWYEFKQAIDFANTYMLPDVVLIPLPAGKGNSCFSYQSLEIGTEMYRHAHDLLPFDSIGVVGYPWKVNKPIFKTCFIASLVQSYENYFFIDCKTKRGMSGSPSFHLKWHTGVPRPHQTIIGIYSGRIKDEDSIASNPSEVLATTTPTSDYSEDSETISKQLNDMDIGIVWNIRLVIELLHIHNLI